MKDESISRVMTPAPATVAPSASAAEAEQLMRKHACHHLPVVDGGRLLGMLSSRDLLKAMMSAPGQGSDRAAAFRAVQVADIMQRQVVALPQTATVLDAAKALADGELHALPVVAPGNVVAGIVTSTDLIETLVDGLEHPAGAAAPPQPEQAASDAQLRMLRQVYRAVRNYLESGRAELEHTRLLQAVNAARETFVRIRVHI